jgi:uncharacterized membrane protein YkoI
MMTRNRTFAAIMAYVIATGAAGSMVMSPALASPAEEAAQDFAGWRAAQKAAAEQAASQQTEPRNGMATRAQKGRDVAGISLPQARAIALATTSGKIVDEELEHERGGSGLRYSFDIKNGPVTHEVGVDAKTGRVLENSVERAQ